MAAHAPETHPSRRHHGLIFDWHPRRTPHFAKAGILVLTAFLFAAPWMTLRVKVGNPPVQNHRSAALMMLTPGTDPMHWIEAARDLGPFPTRFEPTDWPELRTRIHDVLESSGRSNLPPRQPSFEELPDNEAVAPPPLITKGSRILPPVQSPPLRPATAPPMRLAPKLYPLTTGADSLPVTNPPFEVDVTPEMAYEPWRFLLQIAPNGDVVHATALVGHNTPGRPSLSRWLESHRFPAHSDSSERWIAVALTFQNQLTHGTDDP